MLAGARRDLKTGAALGQQFDERVDDVLLVAARARREASPVPLAVEVFKTDGGIAGHALHQSELAGDHNGGCARPWLSRTPGTPKVGKHPQTGEAGVDEPRSPAAPAELAQLRTQTVKSGLLVRWAPVFLSPRGASSLLSFEQHAMS